jgi:hypothetical protein
MATADEPPNAAAICQALACPGCFDCRDDDSDTTWDGKDDAHFWACPKPDCDTPRDQYGDCPDCGEPLRPIGADGYEVTT